MLIIPHPTCQNELISLPPPEVFLSCISSLRFRLSRIPPLLSSCIRSNLCWTLETMVCVAPYGLRCSSAFVFIFYATPNPQLVCNSKYKTWNWCVPGKSISTSSGPFPGSRVNECVLFRPLGSCRITS